MGALVALHCFTFLSLSTQTRLSAAFCTLPSPEIELSNSDLTSPITNFSMYFCKSELSTVWERACRCTGKTFLDCRKISFKFRFKDKTVSVGNKIHFCKL